MQEIENDEYLLVVGDDGIGLPMIWILQEPLYWVLFCSTLVNQLEGNLKIDRTNGTIF